MSIAKATKDLLSELPSGVELVVAAKTRTPAEILETVNAGATNIGENYLAEAERAYGVIGPRVRWHFIGRVQKNKVDRIVGLFDMIETLDTIETAGLIETECAAIGKMMPVLVEINSGCEEQKSGILPDKAPGFIRSVSNLRHVKIMGLMTMGPHAPDPGQMRPYFAATRQLFYQIGQMGLKRVEMRYLSMGMTDSYKIAIEEGANIVRIGSKIFGPRRG